MCRIFLYLDLKKENTDQKKHRIWILFTQYSESMSIESQGLTHFKCKKKKDWKTRCKNTGKREQDVSSDL